MFEYRYVCIIVRAAASPLHVESGRPVCMLLVISVVELSDRFADV